MGINLSDRCAGSRAQQRLSHYHHSLSPDYHLLGRAPPLPVPVAGFNAVIVGGRGRCGADCMRCVLPRAATHGLGIIHSGWDVLCAI